MHLIAMLRNLPSAFRHFAFAMMMVAFSFATVRSDDPVVARMEMKLTLKEEVIDTIQKGDLLTILKEREDSYVIQTFNGQKGAVAKVNVAKIPESVPIYDELIEESPKEGRLYTLRAGAHWSLGNIEKAIADFDQAIELGYAAPHAYMSRGLFYAATGNTEKAIADYSKAIELDSADEVPLINRASVYLTTGNFEKAIADYSQAIEKRPENPVLYTQRAIAKKQLGDLNGALSDYDRAIELLGNDISAIMGRGFIQFQLGNHESAITDFSKVIELSPQSAVAYNNRGYNYQMLKQFQLALADYRRAVELTPEYLLARQNLGWLLSTCEDEQLRDPAEAIKNAEAVCTVTEFSDVADLTLLAAAFASAGEFKSAIGWQEKAVELAKDETKEVAKKILQLYQDKKPMDLKLLEVQPKPSTE